MITFCPAARPVSNGYSPMVTLRRVDGTMAGSQTQSGTVFVTKADAKAHALLIALRAAMSRPDMLTVCKG